MNKRDAVILEKIIKYCDRIKGIMERFELDFGKLSNDYVIQMSVSMGILQIGELANGLTDEFRVKHKAIPWRQIINMRNKAAHAYDEFDLEMVWETITTDIPLLRVNCERILANDNEGE
jgi:uncharacterized protein with HEPN domain